MDLAYIPEVLTFGSFRNPQYPDYEQSWSKDYSNYGKSSVSVHLTKQPRWYYERQEKTISTKHNCHLCREKKRRSLAAYIKDKSKKNSCPEIHEEEEHEDQEDKIVQVNNKSKNHEYQTS